MHPVKLLLQHQVFQASGEEEAVQHHRREEEVEVADQQERRHEAEGEHHPLYLSLDLGHLSFPLPELLSLYHDSE
jgi:hypothetical protein